MTLLDLFFFLFFLLGVALGPLLLAIATVAFSEPRGKALGKVALSIGLQSVWRPALTFNAANELVLKRRGYDEKHDEQKISFGGLLSGVERFLFDPQNRIHDFYGTPFAFVDERFGIVIDPRDSVIGRELREHQERGVYTRRIVRGETFIESVLAVFELPKGHVGARMPDVWSLVGGSSDAQWVRKIHEFYRKGQDPKTGTTAFRQLIIPAGTFIGILLIGMFAGGGGAGGGGAADAADRTVGVGSSLLLLLGAPLSRYYRFAPVLVVSGLAAVLLYFLNPLWMSIAGVPIAVGPLVGAVITAAIMTIMVLSGGGDDQDEKQSEPKDQNEFLFKDDEDEEDVDNEPQPSPLQDSLVAAVILGVYGLLTVGLYLWLPTWVPLLGIPLPLGIWGAVLMLIGMAVVPFTAAWLGRGLGGLGTLLGKLFIVIGLLPWDRPVITLVDPHTYELAEYEDHEWPVEPEWYRFALTRIGVGFANNEKLWHDDVVERPARVKAMAQIEADGGTPRADSPSGYSTTNLIQQDEIYGYVPDEVDEDSLYVRTDLTTGWFEEAGQNRRLMLAALEYAKEKFGEGTKPMSDRTIMVATFGAIVLGVFVDWVFFFS